MSVIYFSNRKNVQITASVADSVDVEAVVSNIAYVVITVDSAISSI